MSDHLGSGDKGVFMVYSALKIILLAFENDFDSI